MADSSAIVVSLTPPSLRTALSLRPPASVLLRLVTPSLQDAEIGCLLSSPPLPSAHPSRILPQVLVLSLVPLLPGVWRCRRLFPLLTPSSRRASHPNSPLSTFPFLPSDFQVVSTLLEKYGAPSHHGAPFFFSSFLPSSQILPPISSEVQLLPRSGRSPRESFT